MEDVQENPQTDNNLQELCKKRTRISGVSVTGILSLPPTFFTSTIVGY